MSFESPNSPGGKCELRIRCFHVKIEVRPLIKLGFVGSVTFSKQVSVPAGKIDYQLLRLIFLKKVDNCIA